MKIEEFDIWKDGSVKTATDLSLRIVNDDLASSATFYYSIMGESMLADGNLSIDGDSYQEWTGSSAEAYEYAAQKLGLTLISEA
jgi:hypothetical protein